MALALITFLVGLWVLISLVVWSVRTGISPMPSSRAAKQALLKLLQDRMHEGVIYELGAGWGTLAFPLAKAFPRCHIIAFERSPIPYYFCRCRQLLSNSSNLTLIRDDFFTYDLSAAAVVICYLYPGAMDRLKNKFDKELRLGALILSNTFAISGWKPIETVRLNDLYRTPIYLYLLSESDNDRTFQ